MKGVSSLIASVMLVLITVVASVFISGWLTSTTARETNQIKNSTTTQLQCQFADIYIRNFTFDCGAGCAAGNAHTATATVVNSGKRSVSIEKIYLRNSTGNVFALDIAPVTMKVSDVTELTNISYADCSGIRNAVEFVSVITTNCPNTAYDNLEGSQVSFVNC